MSAFLFGMGVIVALAYLPLAQGAPGWSRSVVKTAPLALFSVAALFSGAPPWLGTALVFSALGDFALSRRGEGAFLLGLGGFALAHLAYILLFLEISGVSMWGGIFALPVLAAALIALGLSAEVWLIPHVGPLRWPVRFYVLIITLMGLASLTGGVGVVTAGAILFILSDVLLAVQLFRLAPDSALAAPLGWLIWGFYITGQATIFSGVLQS